MATVRLQLRRGLAQDWFDANPTLAAGEIGIETDTNTFKFGDGDTLWRDLDYALSGTVDDYIPLTQKAVAGGVASLDSSGFVPVSQLPPLAKVTVNAVANQAARLALTAEAGDIAIQADNGQSYVLSASPASTDANWKALVGSEAVVDTVETALIAGTGLDKTYDDAAGTITIDIDSTVATKTYADQAEADAISTASSDATTKANAAQAAAISAAAADATSKANAAKSAAEATASADATSKANAAQAAAEATAAADATTKANAAKTAAEAYADAAVSILTNASPDALNTLNELAAALGDDANFASTVTNSLSLKANINDPSFTGNVTLPSTTIIGSVNNQEIAYLDGVTSPIQGQIDNKAPLASPTLTGTVTLPESTSIGSVSNLEIGYLNGVTSSVQGQIDAKAPLESPTFTGTVTLPANTITQSMMSDDSVGTNEIGGFAVTAAKLAVDSVTETKIADGSVTSAKIANGTIVNADINDSAAIAQSKIDGLGAALDLKAPKADPTFTGTVTGVTKAHVGLGNVDNTADASKPVSTAQATAIATAKSEAIADATSQVNALLAGAPAALNTLDELAAALGDDANFASTVTTNLAAKAPIASPTFTGTVTVAAAGVAFTDGTQTKAGVPSLTTIGTEISADYNLSTGGLALRDQLIPVAGTRAITIPTNATTAFPVGTSIDFYQSSGTGANFVAADGTVTILRTPGLKLRTTHSSATLTKVATNTWLLAGDLTA